MHIQNLVLLIRLCMYMYVSIHECMRVAHTQSRFGKSAELDEMIWPEIGLTSMSSIEMTAAAKL